MTDDEIIDVFRLNLVKRVGKALDYLMESNSASIINLAKKRGLNEEDGQDILQETLTDFYYRTVSGKFVKGDAKISTFIFHVATNKMIDLLRKRKKIFLEEDNFIDYSDNVTPETIFLNFEKMHIIEEAFELIGENCRLILKDSFGSNGLSYEELAQKYQYSSAEAVGTTLSRCRKKLLKAILDNPILLGKIIDAFHD